MKRSINKLAGVAALALAAAVVAQPSQAADETPTYEEFKASTYVDEGGQYVVNGDEPLSSERKLQQFYSSMVNPKSKPGGTGGKGGKDNPGLIVNTVGGQDDKWSNAQVGSLTYCVSTSFGSDYADIVSVMQSGANQWEGASSAIDFVHVSSQDGNCNTSNYNVVFSVEPVNTSQYIARAFFPSSPKYQRNVLVDDSIWTSGSWTPSNIMAHELGHVLGFRHEHSRPESGACFEDNNWRPLTPYDSSSIMHYPQCNGTSSNLSMTATDRQGVRALYGS